MAPIFNFYFRAIKFLSGAPIAFKIILGFLFLSFLCFVFASPPTRKEDFRDQRTDNPKL